MTSLTHTLGLSSYLAFHDVYSIDDADLLAFVPRPVLALLLVFPVSETYERFREAEDATRSKYEGSGEEEEVVWFKQTIGNACGLIGLLHGVCNGGARKQIGASGFGATTSAGWGVADRDATVAQSDLSHLLAQAIPLNPAARADLLYDSPALESAHAAAASTGDTAAPAVDDDVDLHYVCFVKSAAGNLWEMDGRRKGPLMRGKLDDEEDVLSEKGLQLGVRSFLRREEQAGGGELRFSLVALAPGTD